MCKDRSFDRWRTACNTWPVVLGSLILVGLLVCVGSGKEPSVATAPGPAQSKTGRASATAVQEGGAGPNGPRFGESGFAGPGPGGAAFNGAAALASVKTRIRASDEEWKIIEPMLRKVIAARLAMETGMNAGESADIGGRRGGFGPPWGGGPGGPGGPGFGRDSFTGPNESGAGGFGPPGFGPPGFGPPWFGPGQPASQERSKTPDSSAKSGTSPDNSKATATNAPAPARGPAGGPPPGFGGRDSAIAQAMADLRTAAADAKISADDLKKKVAAVRTARQKAREKFEAAKKDLLELLTPDQEAMLLGLGYID